MELCITIDVGTTFLKGGLFSMKGELLQNLAIPMTYTPANDHGEVFAPTAQWEKGLGDLFLRLLPQEPYQLRGIAISGHGPTVIPLYKNGLYDPQSTMWMDESATESSRTILDKTGVSLPPKFLLPKILKIQTNSPKKFDQISSFLGTSEFLSYLLTGEVCTILPSRGWKSHYWNSRLLRKLHIDTDLLPKFIMPGDVIGQVTRKQAARYRIPHGVPVVAGGPDFMMAIVGSGVISEGMACNRSGSSEGVNLCISRQYTSFKEGLFCTNHIIPKRFLLSGTMASSGIALTSLWKSFGRNKSFTHFLNWTLHDIPEGRSFYQEMAKNGIDQVLAELKKLIVDISEIEDFTTLRVTGGVKNPAFLQLKANVTGKTIETLNIHSAELLGDFIMLQKGIGEIKTVRQGVRSFVKVESRYIPNSAES